MKRKKNRHIVLIIIGLVILLLVLNWFGVFDNLKSKKTYFILIPKNTEISSPKKCDAQHCTFKSMLECSNGQGTTKTVFRTNGQWIAWDIDGSGLRCYAPGGDTTPHCNAPYSVTETIASGKPVFSGQTFYANANNLFQKGDLYGNSDTQWCSTNVYTSGSNICNLQPTATNNPAYTEINEGPASTYNCAVVFNVYYPDGTTLFYSEVLSKPASESGENPWNKNSTEIPVDNGFIGKLENPTNGAVGHLYYGTSEDRLSCGAGNIGVCSQSRDTNGDHTGYYNCINDNGAYYLDISHINPCDLDNGLICIDSIGNCSFPLSYDVKFVDSNQLAKSGFGPSENIYVNTKITTSSSSQVKNGNVNILIYHYGESTPLANYNLGNYDFTKSTTISTPINNPGNAYLGQWVYAVLAITYNNKTIYVGRDNKDYSIRIAPTLSCNVQFLSNINGQTRTTLYKGYPVDLKIFTSVSGQASPVDNLNIQLSLNTGNGVVPITLNNNSLKSSGVATSDSSVWEYIYEFTPTNTGSLDPIISITKSSVSQDCNAQSTTIKDLTVTPSFTNIAKYTYKCVQQNSATDLTIEIKDDIGNYIEPQNLALKVIFSNTTLQQDITGLLQKKEVGKYHFTYNFPQIGSTYFQISSSIFNGINTGALDVLSSCTLPDCVQNSDCASGKVCKNNQCTDGTGPNWILYIGIGAGILAGIIILIIIFRLLNKPRQNVYTGLEGL